MCQGTISLLDMRQYTVEFIQTAVVENQPALAARTVLNVDPGTQFIRQLVLQLSDIRINRRRRLVLALRTGLPLPHQRFRLSHREPPSDNGPRGMRLGLALERQQAARMPHIEVPML